MLIVGERINTSRKAIAEAVASRDAAFIQHEATAQEAAGAHYLDVNAGTFIDSEAEHLKWIVEVVQEVTELPLCIDSPDPAVIESILPSLKKTPILNSITLEKSRLHNILPLAVDHKTKLIALCQSEDSAANTTEEKFQLAERLIEITTSAGLALDDLYIDPLVYPLATDQHSALAFLSAVEKIMSGFPGVHTICGLTNVSHGLPLRRLVNRSFMVAAVLRGLDAAIMDPTDKGLQGALKAALMIAAKDDYCMGFIKSYKKGQLE